MPRISTKCLLWSCQYLPRCSSCLLEHSKDARMPWLCFWKSFWTKYLHFYLCMIILLQAISLKSYQLKFLAKFLNHLHLLFVFLLQKSNVFFLPLAWVFRRLSISLELFFFGDGSFVLLSGSQIDIIILLLDKLSRFHQAGQFIAIKYLLLVFARWFIFVVSLVDLDEVIRLIVHLLLDDVLFYRFVAMRLYFAILLKNVVVASQVLEKVLILWTRRPS